MNNVSSNRHFEMQRRVERVIDGTPSPHLDSLVLQAAHLIHDYAYIEISPTDNQTIREQTLSEIKADLDKKIKGITATCALLVSKHTRFASQDPTIAGMIQDKLKELFSDLGVINYDDGVETWLIRHCDEKKFARPMNEQEQTDYASDWYQTSLKPEINRMADAAFDDYFKIKRSFTSRLEEQRTHGHDPDHHAGRY